MIVDTLENLEKYAGLNPLFAQAVEFLKSHDLNALEVGKQIFRAKTWLSMWHKQILKQKNRPNWKLTMSLSTYRFHCRALK